MKAATGELLWGRTAEGVLPAPNFGQWGLSYRRFKDIKEVFPFIFSAPHLSMTDDWWHLRGSIGGFNENRSRTITFVKSKK